MSVTLKIAEFEFDHDQYYDHDQRKIGIFLYVYNNKTYLDIFIDDKRVVHKYLIDVYDFFVYKNEKFMDIYYFQSKEYFQQDFVKYIYSYSIDIENFNLINKDAFIIYTLFDSKVNLKKLILFENYIFVINTINEVAVLKLYLGNYNFIHKINSQYKKLDIKQIDKNRFIIYNVEYEF